MPAISILRVKPRLTPSTRLATSVRAVPHIIRARSESSRGLTEILPSSRVTTTSRISVRSSVPNLPSARTRWPSTVTVTPLGMTTGCLPTRDIAGCSVLKNLAENFAAHVRFSRFAVGDDAARRRQDSDAETIVNAGNILELGVHPASRLGDATDFADRRLAFMIL